MYFHCKAPAWRSSAWRTCLPLLALIFMAHVKCDESRSLDSPQAQKRVLRITADPNNLPFSNDKLEGFENKIAEVIARDLNAEIHYSWRAQRRGFFRETLKADQCDLVMGVPVGFERALTTKAYYRSSYVFVYRKNSGWQINSFDDDRLRSARVGVQLVGDDGMNTPPAHALAARGIITNVVGFTLYGDYAEPNPPARIVDAVANDDIDVAVVWGPLGGYFAKREKTPLAINLINAETEPPPLKFAFGIALGVKRGNNALRDELDAILEKRKVEIDKILDEYGVPCVEKAKQTL